MLKIKQAMDKAYTETLVVEPEDAADIAGMLPDGLLKKNIRYTQTRIIPVADEVWRKNRLLHDGCEDYMTSAYKMLRTRVLQRVQLNNWNSIAVTSALPGEGKTQTALNLAISLSREVDKTVLLVDLDLANPGVHKLLDCKPMYDLSDYLFQHTDLEEILFSPGLEGLVILPGGKPMRDSSEILSSPRMRALAEEIKGRYDSRIVIFDLPPLLVSDDALAFSPHVDSMLLVIEEGRASKQQLRAALDLLGATKLLGVVLNKSQERMPTQS